MEKNDFTGLLVYIIMLVLAFIVGQTIISLGNAEVSEMLTITYPAYVIICIILSALLFTLVYEIGHIIGAKIGKYKVSCINFCGLCFTKIDNKWKFSFKAPEGLISETRFTPIDAKGNPKCFLWGGVVAFLITMLISFSTFLINDLPATIKYGVLIYISIGIILLFYNIVPIPLDVLNDGYRIKLLGNKSNVEAYNEFMRIENDVRNGEEPHDVKVYDNISAMTATVNMYRFYELMDQNNLKEAENIIDMMIERGENLDNATLTRLKAHKLWFVVMNSTLEESSKYYWKKMTDRERKDISQDKNYVSRRAYLLISGVINKSISESRIALSNYKSLNKISDKLKKRVELKLYEQSIEKVKTIIPDADFTDLL